MVYSSFCYIYCFFFNMRKESVCSLNNSIKKDEKESKKNGNTCVISLVNCTLSQYTFSVYAIKYIDIQYIIFAHKYIYCIQYIYNIYIYLCMEYLHKYVMLFSTSITISNLCNNRHAIYVYYETISATYRKGNRRVEASSTVGNLSK